MDKPDTNDRRTITIKINSVRNRKEAKGEEMNERKPSQSQESINLEAAAAKETEVDGEDFEWLLPTEPGNPVSETKQYQEKDFASGKKEAQRKGPLKLPLQPEKKKWLTTIFLIVFCAVIVGTIFGMTMLKIVSPDEMQADGSIPSTGVSSENNSGAAANGGKEFQLPALTTYVVQAGIYSSEETALSEQERLRGQGLPAQAVDMSGIGMEGKYALFVSISGSINEAKKISQDLSAAGTETFAKEVSFSGKTIAGITAEEAKLLALSPQLFQTMNSTEDSKEAFEQLEKIDKEQLQNDKVKQIYGALTAAATEYKKITDKPDRETEKALQQYLLHYLSLYLSMSTTHT